jgi:hypothetical protein
VRIQIQQDSFAIDRIDIRPSSGIVSEPKLTCTTAHRRHSSPGNGEPLPH